MPSVRPQCCLSNSPQAKIRCSTPKKPRKIPSVNSPPGQNGSKPHQCGPAQCPGQNSLPNSIKPLTASSRKTPLANHKIASKLTCFFTLPSAAEATLVELAAAEPEGTAPGATAFPHDPQYCAPALNCA